MKNYYVELVNGESCFISARTDYNAYVKADNFSRKLGSAISYFAESFVDSEIDRIIEV